ncbi:hypothetical protein M8J75_011999 [Diaphorina citri]|nr:hypothetical protein M8J75_011999 [Diaphorina citri]
MLDPEEIAEEVDEDERVSGDSKNDNMFSFLKYLKEWQCFYNPEYRKEIHENSLHGELRSSSFRSVCWQMLLNILSYEQSNQDPNKNNTEANPAATPDEDQKSTQSCVEEWSARITENRSAYEELKQSLALDPTLSRVDNPLSQNTESVWYKHFCDTELKTVIRQDVIRTFPGLDFFRNNEHIQDIMVAILFCYARKYPHMCYRQGMHEILAPIIFVLHCDHQALLHALEVSPVDDHLMVILNDKYLEHDAFTIFCKVMSSIENYYLINDSTPTSSGYFAPNSNSSSFSSITDNHVVTQLYYINEHILKPADPALHDQLYNLKIPLTLFGIRWLRLLFGREFSLQDLLVLWDVIFAEGSQETEAFDLVNYVVVAMLIAIRDQILSSDHIECLSYLMRYPPGIDVTSIIEHALHLKYPHLYPEYEHTPQHTQVSELTPVPPVEEAVQKPKKKSREKKYRFLNLTSRNKINPTGPDIMEALPIVEETGLTLSAQSQLIYYRDIMCSCHSTLTRCCTLIESNLTSQPRVNSAAMMTHVLRDIKQVCSMLEAGHLSPPRSLVEMAAEANESRLHTPASSPLPPSTPPTGAAFPKEATGSQAFAKSVKESQAFAKSNKDSGFSAKSNKELGSFSRAKKKSCSEESDEDVPLNLPPPRSDVDMKTFSCKEMDGEVGGGDFPASYPHHVNDESLD